jgi:Kef-type K+ transport system membrane component KefB
MRAKGLLFYAVILIGLTLSVYLILQLGKALEVPVANQIVNGNTNPIQVIQQEIKPESANSSFLNAFEQLKVNLNSPISILFLQIISIIILSRILGYFFGKIGQPLVIAEIIAGILLGPSVLGHLSPEIFSYIFPPNSLFNLEFLAQIGLMLFMFVIGMELDTSLLKNRAKEAIVISHVSIAFPYFLGVALAYFLYSTHAPQNISFIEFALFIGIAMSITAFPVLARILLEKNLTKTPLGSIVITCAAADDISAWCILAVVIAIVKAGTILSALVTIGLTMLFVLVMLYVIRPLIKSWSNTYIEKPNRSKMIISMIFALLLISSFTTEVIGIHALFGAFLTGVIIPEDLSFKKLLVKRVEDISLILLLPLFFVYTGLRTDLSLLFKDNIVSLTFIVIVIATVGKFGGSAIAARFLGISTKESLIIGVLMNTRGLMELVVINIGYNLGILTPQLFAVFVIMALTTTFTTSPAIDFVQYLSRTYFKSSRIETSQVD